MRQESRNYIFEHKKQQSGDKRDVPDPVRVPGLMDNDLGGTDGDGTSLIIPQIMFAQVDPVGVTAVWV